MTSARGGRKIKDFIFFDTRMGNIYILKKIVTFAPLRVWRNKFLLQRALRIVIREFRNSPRAENGNFILWHHLAIPIYSFAVRKGKNPSNLFSFFFYVFFFFFVEKYSNLAEVYSWYDDFIKLFRLVIVKLAARSFRYFFFSICHSKIFKSCYRIVADVLNINVNNSRHSVA